MEDLLSLASSKRGENVGIIHGKMEKSGTLSSWNVRCREKGQAVPPSLPG